MNSIQNLQWRYAVKKFDDNKFLNQDQIDLLKEAFNLTQQLPTDCNLSNW